MAHNYSEDDQARLCNHKCCLSDHHRTHIRSTQYIFLHNNYMPSYHDVHSASSYSMCICILFTITFQVHKLVWSASNSTSSSTNAPSIQERQLATNVQWAVTTFKQARLRPLTSYSFESLFNTKGKIPCNVHVMPHGSRTSSYQ